MMAAQMDARRRCYNHPHRETALACERCRTSYCGECLPEPADDGPRLCANCQREVAAAEAARLTFKERVVLQLRSLVRGTIIGLVIIAILGGSFYLFRDKFERPLEPEELARFRYAISGSFETDEGVNLNSTVVGGKMIGATSAAEGHPAKQVINEFTGEGIPAWRSTTATFPQEITVEFPDLSSPQKITLQNNPIEQSDTYARDVEVQVSTEGPDTGFVTVGKFVAQPNTELQRFTFDKTPAHWIRLRILSNYGSAEYTSLDEFGAYMVSNNPMRSPLLTPTVGP
jgi:hypothetical protein